MWEKIVTFLKENDIHTIGQTMQGLNWGDILKNPFFWLVALPLSGWIVWKKQFKLLILAGSFVAFTFVFQYALPSAGQEIGLPQLLKFLGGAVVIIGINIYFFFIRQD